MGLGARGPWCSGAVVAFALLLAATSPAAAAPAPSSDPIVAPAAKKKRKPVSCKPAQAVVTLGKTKRCVTLRKPPKQGDARLALLRGLLRRDPGVVRARGRRIGPIWNAAGGRVKRMRAKLLRDLPRFLAFADAARAKASESVSGDRNCRGGLGESTGSFDGFSLTSADNGDVTITASVSSGYAIQVFIGGAVRCSDLDLPACPKADGTLDGTDGRGNALGFRVTKDGRLVQALRTVVRSKQTMKAKVADDAKLETMTLEDIANERTTFSLPDVTLNVTVSVRRAAEIDMRSGLPKPGTTKIQLGIRGLVGADATTWTDRVRAGYEQSFPELISEEVGAYRRREALWQTPGTCAKVTFEPPSDMLTLLKDAPGQMTARIEANAGGVAAKGKWTVSGVANGTITPGNAEGGSPSFSYVATRAGENVKLSGSFRATSTAGVAEKSWSQPTLALEPPIKWIHGTFSGGSNIFGGIYTWEGSGAFEPLAATPFGANGLYQLTSALVTYHASGSYAYYGAACTMSGSRQISLAKGQGSMSVTSVIGAPAPMAVPVPGAVPKLPGKPYDYGIGVTLPGTAGLMDVTLSACADSDLNGTTAMVALGGDPLVTGETPFRSDDGLAYVGSTTAGAPPASSQVSWSLYGETTDPPPPTGG